MLDAPGFDDPVGRALAFTIAGFGGSADLHVMMNMFWEPLEFEIPVDSGRQWHLVIDTSAEGPGAILDLDRTAPYPGHSCRIAARSIVVLRSIADS
jgi:glycogen operon protein